MWKMYFIGCETILDFVSEICDFFSWQSLPIGDHLIPIPIIVESMENKSGQLRFMK